MNVTVYLNESSENVINKKLNTIFTANIHGDISAISLNTISLKISTNNLTFSRFRENCNYCYIDRTYGYYFIRNIKLLSNGIAEIIAELDVLETFKDIILNSNAIINNAENYAPGYYLPSDSWVNTCRNKTDVVSFSNGLLDNGEFILVTAGG